MYWNWLAHDTTGKCGARTWQHLTELWVCWQWFDFAFPTSRRVASHRLQCWCATLSSECWVQAHILDTPASACLLQLGNVTDKILILPPRLATGAQLIDISSFRTLDGSLWRQGPCHVYYHFHSFLPPTLTFACACVMLKAPSNFPRIGVRVGPRIRTEWEMKWSAVLCGELSITSYNV